MKVMMKFISILVVLWTLGDATKNCGQRKYEHKGNCCDKCRPGQQVARHCSAKNRTTCEPCKFGTVMTTHNEKTHCDSCPHMQYYDINLSYCMNCRACPKGEYPVEKCSPVQNTKCEACPKNHYSNITANNNFTCKPCTTCRRYKRKCTQQQDAVCDGYVSTTPITKPTTIVVKKPTVLEKLDTTEKTSLVRKENSSKKQGNTIWIPVAVVLFVFFLALVVIYLCARRKARCHSGDGFNIGSRRLRYEPLRTGLLLRNQPASFILKLAEFLNPDGRPNWKNLAANFKDFTWNEIENFAVDRNAAAERMLCAWQTKNTATLDKLHECLMNIKREDVATYVAEFAGVSSADTPV